MHRVLEEELNTKSRARKLKKLAWQGRPQICVETHPDVLGDRVLSELFARLVGQGFALDFSLIRKNVFFFQRGTG